MNPADRAIATARENLCAFDAFRATRPDVVALCLPGSAPEDFRPAEQLTDEEWEGVQKFKSLELKANLARRTLAVYGLEG